LWNLPKISQNKPVGPSLSIRVIEDWLEETLNNVNELRLCKKMLKDDKKTMIRQYGIDRYLKFNKHLESLLKMLEFQKIL
jgi:hypothetical protein